MPSRSLSSGKCVHCLGYFNDLTWDHVLPVSWYPDIPSDLEKWAAPSCVSCNKKLGRIEEELLIKLGLCLDPRDKHSLGIPEKNPSIIESIIGQK
jgi:hypothetical protein